MFTSLESADLSSALRVEATNGALEPFRRSQLFISIYDCCRHLPQAPQIADDLTNTVITKLLKTHQAIISATEIAQVTLVTLKHFNKAAGAQYGAFHET